MRDPLDVDLQDDDLLAEILLLTDLMATASQSERPLPQSVIDRILRGSVAIDPTDPRAPNHSDRLARSGGSVDGW